MTKIRIKSLEKKRERNVARIRKLAKEIRESGIMNDYFDKDEK